MKFFDFRIFTVLILFSCQPRIKNNQSKKIDKWSTYILNNETALNADLDKAIIDRAQKFPELAIHQSTSVVFLSLDTSLNDSNFKEYPHIGQFSAYIHKIDSCLLVSYTYKKDTSQRKIMTLFKNYSLPCMVNIDTILTSVDTTEHFIVVKDNEPSIVDIIEIGERSIHVQNLRFRAIKHDSLVDVEVYINPDSTSFTITNEMKGKLPEATFGKELLMKKIHTVDIKLMSSNDKELLTITQFQRKYIY
ncbi:MAG TPA: hypothetical protein VGQ53_04815 [Chitinophagaceae bacterium]|jgi:hypothetical protein|nr:hypothetical protein [Chitinophagaceae bacterium]